MAAARTRPALARPLCGRACRGHCDRGCDAWTGHARAGQERRDSRQSAASGRAAGGRSDPPRCRAVDIEAFSRNIARLIEEGGKALAAYMKPREEGKIKADAGRGHRRRRSRRIGQVAEYWLSDPQRALELQASLGRAYLDLWAGAVKRMAGEDERAGGRARRRATSASPIRNGRRTSSSISSSRPICSPRNGPTSWSRTPRRRPAHARTRPSSTSSRSPTRSRRRTSSSPIRSCCARRCRRTPKTSCAACTCWPRTSRPATAI